jgi:hypothetical protein
MSPWVYGMDFRNNVPLEKVGMKLHGESGDILQELCSR